MIRTAIFDVDGTLVDSVDLHAQAWHDAFAEFGHDIALKAIRDQIGKGGDQLMPVFLDPAEIEARGEALQKRRGDILKERYLPRIKPFAQVRALFERLRDANIAILLASSAKADELQTYKTIAEIDDLVATETTSDDTERSKPHPDIFQSALKRVGDVSPRDCVVIGDTPYDAEAAGKAGLRTIGVLCGGWDEAALRRAGCVVVYRDPADLLANFDACFLAPSS